MLSHAVCIQSQIIIKCYQLTGYSKTGEITTAVLIRETTIGFFAALKITLQSISSPSSSSVRLHMITCYANTENYIRNMNKGVTKIWIDCIRFLLEGYQKSVMWVGIFMMEIINVLHMWISKLISHHYAKTAVRNNAEIWIFLYSAFPEDGSEPLGVSSLATHPQRRLSLRQDSIANLIHFIL